MSTQQENMLMENQLRLVMVDRMLKEKYNEIQYLAIQPPKDPDIEEINKNDLAWLLSEHERCEQLEHWEGDYYRLRGEYENLEQQYQAVINSRSWRWALRIGKILYFFRHPIRTMRGKA